MTTSAEIDGSPKQRKRKLPPEWPTFACKCMWDATSLTIKVKAKNEADAWDRAWKQVSRMDGGMYCLSVKVKGVIS